MLPDIGLWEFLIIGMAALIFVKPDDWPRFLRKVGRTYGRLHETMVQLRRYGRDAYDEITRMDMHETLSEDDRNAADPVDARDRHEAAPDYEVDGDDDDDYDVEGILDDGGDAETDPAADREESASFRTGRPGTKK